MKNGIPRCLGLALITGSLTPLAAHAFLDERTPPPPPPPPAQIAPAIVAPKLIVPIAPVAPVKPIAAPAAQTAIPGVNAVMPAAQAGVTGDFTGAAWTTPYPGPFGTMPLADALIAQIVPVVGTAIELNGAPELLNQKVVVPTGATRLATLKSVAAGSGLTISLAGNRVNLAKASTAPVVSATTVTALGAEAVPVTHATKPAPALAPVKSWHLAKGAMLSTAMLEWAQKWGWELIWKADVDYRIAADISLNETFLNGVGKVLEAYRTGNRPLWGDWNDEQKVLVIREPNNRDN